MEKHRDILSKLDRNIPLGEKVEYIHGVLRERCTSIDRISVTIYDPKTDLLSTFVDSGDADSPRYHYEAPLSESHGLQEIRQRGEPRVLNDLEVLHRSTHERTRQIQSHGYRSSYTMPMFLNGAFFGFIFFNSHQKSVFTDDLLHHLDVFGHLISLVIINEISAIRTLLAALKTAKDMTHHRDMETGAHLDRMSRFAQLIARELAAKYQFDDEYIEHILLFAPLHDIGKIGVPDKILLKPGKLTAREYTAMKGHAEKGRKIIDDMLENFGLESFQHVDILRNIAQFHHEAVNGSGYPAGLAGEEIPIEARIVAVADVFDALTSRRPYKEPWSNDESFAFMRKLAGYKLDGECVAALERNREEVEWIQKRFQEDRYG